MATYRVIPLSDGESQRYGWQVKKNGNQVSKHTKKSAAKRKARQVKKMNDSLIIHGLNGQVLG